MSSFALEFLGSSRTETYAFENETYEDIGLKGVISQGAPSLMRPLVNLITQYLFPEPKNWIAEWTGARGYDVITETFVASDTSLSEREISVIVGYLKKKDVFGLEDLENAAGGKEELRQLLTGNPEIMYQPQSSPSLEIDDEMQKRLGQVWDREFTRCTPHFRVTDVFSLFWCPLGITVTVVEKIAHKHDVRFHRDSYVEKRRDMGAQKDCWIQFPRILFCHSSNHARNQLLDRNMQLKDRLPPGFELACFSDFVFCVFMRCALTKEMGFWILHDEKVEKPDNTAAYCLDEGGGRFVSELDGHLAASCKRTTDLSPQIKGLVYLRKFP